MDFRELEEDESYISKELSLENKIEKSEDIKKLYPEFKFSETYGLRSNEISISNYFPLFEQVILNIYPAENKETFLYWYGIDFDNFIELVKLNVILPIICYPFQKYPSFFLELFKIKRFPRSGRLRDYYEVRRAKEKEPITEMVDSVFQGVDLSYAANEHFPKFNGTQTEKIETFKSSFCSDLYDFNLLDMDELATIILDIAKKFPSEAYGVSKNYCDLLTRPIFENGGGVCSFTDESMNIAKRSYLKTNSKSFFSNLGYLEAPKVRAVEMFLGVDPTELHNFYSKPVSLTFPAKMEDAPSYIEFLRENDLIREMRAFILKSKEEVISQNDIDDMSTLGAEISRQIKLDAAKIGKIADICTSSIYLGSTVPLIAAPLVEAKATAQVIANLIYGYISSNHIEIRSKIREKSANAAIGLLGKPIATLYWKSKN